MEKQPDTLTVFVYTGANGSFTLYEDEGLTYDYEKGNFSTISFNWNDAAKTLTIGDRKGNFDGMLPSRTIRIIIVDKEHPQALNADAPAMQTITYNGKTITAKLAHRQTNP
jgi:alpha-D-xyloside xylohydrolase